MSELSAVLTAVEIADTGAKARVLMALHLQKLRREFRTQGLRDPTRLREYFQRTAPIIDDTVAGAAQASASRLSRQSARLNPMQTRGNQRRDRQVRSDVG